MYQRRDSYYTRAKLAGYRARSAYKLEQLARRYRILRSGDRVVDLGAWPGGWLQVAAREVGPTGKVVGVDLERIDPFPDLPQIALVQGDITEPKTLDRVRALCDDRVDVVLSDLAPKLSGVRDRDVAQAQRLAEGAVQVAERLLRTGGTLVVKLFMSAELSAFLDGLRARFGAVHTTRPEATRKGSAELYAIAIALRPPLST